MKSLKFNNSPEDISEAFGLLCSYLELDKKKEEAACFKGRSKKVTHDVIVNLSERHKLSVTIDFMLERIAVTFEPVTLDIKSHDEVIAEEEQKAAEESKKKMEKAISKEEDQLPFDDDDEFDDI